MIGRADEEGFVLPPPIEFLEEREPVSRPWSAKNFSLKFAKPVADWRADGWTGSVKFQGGCQSCTSHSAASMLEAWMRRQNRIVSVSGPYLHFCISLLGCSVGLDPRQLRDDAVGKVVPPDQAGDVWSSAACGAVAGLTVPSLRQVLDAEDAKFALSNISPVIAGMELAQNFRTGTEVRYDPSGLPAGHHCVCVVGYDDTTWLIQNSFGAQWRDGGFCRVPFGAGNLLTGKWGAIAVAGAGIGEAPFM